MVGVIQTRRWENLLDFFTVFSGWFTSSVERAVASEHQAPVILTRGAEKTKDNRHLQAENALFTG